MAIIKTLRGKTPIIGEDCFLAENSVLVGDVILGNRCSIWFNVVMRGDVNSIVVGDDSNIQDNAVVHCTFQKSITEIGKNVTVGHSAIIHGCKIHDHVLVGMGAKILDNAIIESDVIVAANSVVLERQHLESGFLYAGMPAKKMKPLSQQQIDGIRFYSSQYILYSQWYLEEEKEKGNIY